MNYVHRYGQGSGPRKGRGRPPDERIDFVMERVYDYIESNIDSQFTMKELVREISKYWHDITDEKPPTQLCVQERLKKK